MTGAGRGEGGRGGAARISPRHLTSAGGAGRGGGVAGAGRGGGMRGGAERGGGGPPALGAIGSGGTNGSNGIGSGGGMFVEGEGLVYPEEVFQSRNPVCQPKKFR